MLEIVLAETPKYHSEAKSLIEEYERSLDFELCFQDFEREMAEFPGEYSAPGGCVLIARWNGAPAGCVAVRPIDPVTCEMKRLYVRPAFRGKGIGRALAVRSMEEAKRLGYRRMRLDTIPAMKAAIAIYESLGFADIPPYRHNPMEGARYMEADLR